MLRTLFLSGALVLAGTGTSLAALPASAGSPCAGLSPAGEQIAKSCPRGYRPCAPGCCPAS